MTLFLGLACICMSRAFIGLVGTTLYSHDAFALLDPAWRVLNGQISHLDFFDNLGPVAYFPTVVGLLLAGGDAEGFGYGQAICAFLLGSWAYCLSHRRLSASRRVLLSVLVTLFCAAPIALGDSSLRLSPATTYNLYGYALVSLVMLEALLPPIPKSSRVELLGGVSTGTVIVLLSFTKVTFAAAAGAMFVSFLMCRSQSKPRWRGLAIGFLTTSILFGLYFRFQLMPLLRDMAILARAKHVSLEAYLLENIIESACLLLVFTVSVTVCLKSEESPWLAKSSLIAGITTVFIGLFLILTSHERVGFPLEAFLPIFLLELLHQSSGKTANKNYALRTTISLWALVLSFTILVPATLSLTSGAAQKIRMRHRLLGMQTSRLASFVPVDEDVWYKILVDDGLLLLKQHRKLGDTVMSLDFSNPFSYGLAMSPARGGAIAMQYGTTFDDAHRPTPEWLFGSATLVMIPKQFSDETLEGSVDRIYGLYLNQHFFLVSESLKWKLYRKRASDKVQ